MSKIAVIRLKGLFSISPAVEKTLSSMKLGRLYSCTLISPTPSSMGMLQKVKDFVAYGEADREAIELLLAKRGRTREGKELSSARKPEEISQLASEIASSEKQVAEFGVQNFFALSPPRGGFDGSRKSGQPFGPLGRNAKMSGLIAKMA